VTATGAAAITANGGTLDIASGITDSGNALTLEITGNSDVLKLDGSSAAHTVTFNGHSGTLELTSTSSLTLNGDNTIATGTIKLDGATLTVANGDTLTIDSNATLIGSGTISGHLAGSGTITASGGTLDLTGTVDPIFTIEDGSTLKIDGMATADQPIV